MTGRMRSKVDVNLIGMIFYFGWARCDFIPIDGHIQVDELDGKASLGEKPKRRT
jgi:hypothetical protein